MKKSTDKRKKYWENQYLEYWQDRVSKNSKSSLLRTDIRPAGLSVFNHYYNLAISYLDDKPPKIIDVGIGFGRFVSIYKRDFGNNIWGTDISEKMVNECKRLHPEIRQHLLTVPAECQPFLANFFSFIVCWAVFDATYQEKALWEFQRLLEPRGILLLTGKNTKYLSSDLKAIVAEKKAREKGHPNYFTRVD
jgi:ubiquinone/menaquinone biosynthesis C-methylase UbiE